VAEVNVAGIDFSSLAIDVVLVDLDDLAPPAWHRFELIGQDAFDRTRAVRAAMPTASFWDDTLGIGIEHPAGKFGVGPMMRVQGAVLACLPAGVVVKPWPPGAWRKAVGLPGNAAKEVVSRWAFGNGAEGFWKWTDVGLEPPFTNTEYSEPPPFDCTDAYCIALATRAALVRQEEERTPEGARERQPYPAGKPASQATTGSVALAWGHDYPTRAALVRPAEAAA
jgi:hypothetical protein